MYGLSSILIKSQNIESICMSPCSLSTDHVSSCKAQPTDSRWFITWMKEKTGPPRFKLKISLKQQHIDKIQGRLKCLNL